MPCDQIRVWKCFTTNSHLNKNNIYHKSWSSANICRRLCVNKYDISNCSNIQIILWNLSLLLVFRRQDRIVVIAAFEMNKYSAMWNQFMLKYTSECILGGKVDVAKPSRNRPINNTITSALKQSSFDIDANWRVLIIIIVFVCRLFCFVYVCFHRYIKNDFVFVWTLVTQESHKPTPQVSSSGCFWKSCSKEGISWSSYVKWCPFEVFFHVLHKENLYENVKSNISTVFVFLFHLNIYFVIKSLWLSACLVWFILLNIDQPVQMSNNSLPLTVVNVNISHILANNGPLPYRYLFCKRRVSYTFLYKKCI